MEAFVPLSDADRKANGLVEFGALQGTIPLVRELGTSEDRLMLYPQYLVPGSPTGFIRRSVIGVR
jgi:hypothetical protein